MRLLAALLLALVAGPAGADHDPKTEDSGPWWLLAPPMFPASIEELAVAEMMRAYRGAPARPDPCLPGGYGAHWIADTHGHNPDNFFVYRSLYFPTPCERGSGQPSTLQLQVGTYLQVVGRQARATVVVDGVAYPGGTLWIKHTDMATCTSPATCVFHPYVLWSVPTGPPPPPPPPSCYFSGHHVCP